MAANSAPCTSTDVDTLIVGKIIPTSIPEPIQTLQIYDKATNKRVEADVLSLDSKTIRDRLTSTTTFITLQQRDDSGNLKYLTASANLKRGTYIVTLDYTNFTTQDIQPEDSCLGTVVGEIGVGLRITAELVTTEGGVDLGGLLPISIAYQGKKVSGNLRFYVYGMYNDKLCVAVPAVTTLDQSSIAKAFEAAAAVRVLFSADDTTLEPYLIGVSHVPPSKAQPALNAARKALVKRNLTVPAAPTTPSSPAPQSTAPAPAATSPGISEPTTPK